MIAVALLFGAAAAVLPCYVPRRVRYQLALSERRRRQRLSQCRISLIPAGA